MEVYVEYAILENLLVDGALLYLAQTAAGQAVNLPRLLLASVLGAVFAVLCLLAAFTLGGVVQSAAASEAAASAFGLPPYLTGGVFLSFV